MPTVGFEAWVECLTAPGLWVFMLCGIWAILHMEETTR